MENLINSRIDYLRSQIGRTMTESWSPVGRFLNGVLLSVDHGRMVAEYTIREDLTNVVGGLHGGMSSAILDDLIGGTVFTLGREFGYTTVNLNVDFLHAAKPGDVLTATAEVIRAGRNLIHCEGRLVAADGKIIAKCTSNLVQTSRKLPF
ncbi:PaaI family thioesterase [Spirosoma sp. KUDC1026]|uniref:PaaI family thioesterase n=1 Tax=Spirosoma sp. KUDC1026 TaxID=2745947 RepID=UPI00159BCE1A|nr:PaaI family thioesterase [Spirosoma sp. KUDC1026]QKZ14245.1 PaaI family thioesterase [Spirosoma sp. KUDC1026]